MHLAHASGILSSWQCANTSILTMSSVFVIVTNTFSNKRSNIGCASFLACSWRAGYNGLAESLHAVGVGLLWTLGKTESCVRSCPNRCCHCAFPRRPCNTKTGKGSQVHRGMVARVYVVFQRIAAFDVNPHPLAQMGPQIIFPK